MITEVIISITIINYAMQASPPNLMRQAKQAKNNENNNEASYPPAKRTHADLNILNVVLGNLLIKPWYPSFYPKELVGQRTERLYVCQWCFKYSKELVPYVSHLVRKASSKNELNKETGDVEGRRERKFCFLIFF